MIGPIDILKAASTHIESAPFDLYVMNNDVILSCPGGAFGLHKNDVVKVQDLGGVNGYTLAAYNDKWVDVDGDGKKDHTYVTTDGYMVAILSK
jgi:hypothetical protein